MVITEAGGEVGGTRTVLDAIGEARWRIVGRPCVNQWWWGREWVDNERSSIVVAPRGAVVLVGHSDEVVCAGPLLGFGCQWWVWARINCREGQRTWLATNTLRWALAHFLGTMVAAHDRD